jgi:hypothetical protein
MKVLLVLGLAVGIIVNLTSHAANAKGREENAAEKQKANVLQVSLIAHKRRYKRTDQLKLDVILTNSGKEAVYIFGTLDWGHLASFVLHIRDASGKEVEPVGFFDDLTLASPDDKSAFVKLLPYHFLGTNFFSPLDVLKLNKPGKYAIFVEYHSPFSATDVQLSPFWSKENGTIESNIVWIEVVR